MSDQNHRTNADKESEPYLWRLERGLHKAKLLLKKSERGFSNFGEEEILLRLIDSLLPAGHSRTAVDIGAGDGLKGSNTYALFAAGWRGVGFESHPRKAGKLTKTYERLPQVAADARRVTPENVAALLRAHGVGRGFGVLSLDIDSYDYFVLDAVLSEFRPRIVVTEINEKIPPPIRFRVKFDADFRLSHHFFGYSIQSLEDLCAEHGYAIIELEYNNAFLAPAELPGVRPLKAAEAYRRGYLERPDRREKFSSNADVETLQSLPPAESVEFIKRFFSRHAGKYDISC
jgi:hypothetical protein